MSKPNASEIQQGTGASYKFKVIDKLTPHERSYVKIGHLTKLCGTLKYGSKSIQTSLILRQRPPKRYKDINSLFMISQILFKMGKHSDFHLSFFQIVGAWREFTVATNLIKHFKSLYGIVGRCLKIRDACRDFEAYFRVHNFVSVHPKSIILKQMTSLNLIFHVMV